MWSIKVMDGEAFVLIYLLSLDASRVTTTIMVTRADHHRDNKHTYTHKGTRSHTKHFCSKQTLNRWTCVRVGGGVGGMICTHKLLVLTVTLY